MKKILLVFFAAFVAFSLSGKVYASMSDIHVPSITDGNNGDKTVILLTSSTGKSTNDGRKKSNPKIISPSVEVWIQNGSLFFYDHTDIMDMKVVISDENDVVVYSDYVNVFAGEDVEINLDGLNCDSYILSVTINGVVYSGWFDILF